MRKTPKLFEVRNAKGQYLGTFWALSPKAAITKLKDSDAAYFSTFRGRSPKGSFDNLTATERTPR
jgi:hypothetical protein